MYIYCTVAKKTSDINIISLKKYLDRIILWRFNNVICHMQTITTKRNFQQNSCYYDSIVIAKIENIIILKFSK